MLLDSAMAEFEERKFLEECGGFKLYRLIGEKYGISLNLFRIVSFSHLLYYTQCKPISQLKSFTARLSFGAGYRFGLWLSRRRLIIPIKINQDCLIFYEPTPNQSKHAEKILNKEIPRGTCYLSTYVRMKNIIWGKGPTGSVFEVKKVLRAYSKCPKLREVANIIKPCFNVYHANNRNWFRYGIAMSPLLQNIIDAADKLSSIWEGTVVYFTHPLEMTSILAESFKKKGVRTIHWLHGISGMTFSIRTVCDEAAVYSKFDMPFLKKYSFEHEFWLQPKTFLHTKSFASQSDINLIGYATNLFAGLGPKPCLDETQNPLLIDDGKKCNDIVLEMVKKAGLQSLWLKIHPREVTELYSTFIGSIENEGKCKIHVAKDYEELANNIDHCICHITSLAIELLESGIRVYMFRSVHGNFDSETSIGKVINQFSFDSSEELIKLMNIDDKEYWQMFSNIFSASS